MPFDLDYAIEILPRLLQATVVTIQATFVAMCVALIGGLVICLVRMARVPLLSTAVAAITDAIRSTPLLIQVFVVYYLVLPRLGVPAVPFVAGVLALGLHFSTYTSEVYRAGINSVPRGQREACVALNMKAWTAWRRVILPQAIPPVIPALGNYLIALFKETPVLFVITVVELFATSLQIAGEKYRFFEPIALVGLIFLALSYPSALAIRHMERRLGTA